MSQTHTHVAYEMTGYISDSRTVCVPSTNN